MEHFSVCENGVKRGANVLWNKKEVLQDSAFETNVVSKSSNGVYTGRFDFPNPLFFAFFLHPPLSDCAYTDKATPLDSLLPVKTVVIAVVAYIPLENSTLELFNV